MGCDIHLYKEKKVDGQWVTADEGWVDEYNEGYVDVPWKKRFTQRDYDLFGFLCKGVRREFDFSLIEKGLPEQMSPEVAAIYNHWESDAHSCSYLTLTELKEAWEMLQKTLTPVSGMIHKDQLVTLQETLNSDNPDYNLLYPYCQWTNRTDFVEFNVEIPSSFMLSNVLTLIELFGDVTDNTDDYRIVFWFDN